MEKNQPLLKAQLKDLKKGDNIVFTSDVNIGGKFGRVRTGTQAVIAKVALPQVQNQDIAIGIVAPDNMVFNYPGYEFTGNQLGGKITLIEAQQPDTTTKDKTETTMNIYSANRTGNIIIGVLGVIGFGAGLWFAHSKGSKFWGYVGYSLLGSISGQVLGKGITLFIPPKKA